MKFLSFYLVFMFSIELSIADMVDKVNIKNIPDKVAKNPDRFWIIDLTSDYKKYCPQYCFFWIIDTKSNRSDLLVEKNEGKSVLRNYDTEIPFDFGNKIISQIILRSENKFSIEELIVIKNLILDPRSEILNSNFFENSKIVIDSWDGVEKIRELNREKYFPVIDNHRKCYQFFCISYLGELIQVKLNADGNKYSIRKVKIKKTGSYYYANEF